MSPIRAITNLEQLGYTVTAVRPSGTKTLVLAGHTISIPDHYDVPEHYVVKARAFAFAESLKGLPVLATEPGQ